MLQSLSDFHETLLLAVTHSDRFAYVPRRHLQRHVPGAAFSAMARRWADASLTSADGVRTTLEELSAAVRLTRPRPPAWSFVPVSDEHSLGLREASCGKPDGPSSGVREFRPIVGGNRKRQAPGSRPADRAATARMSLRANGRRRIASAEELTEVEARPLQINGI